MPRDHLPKESELRLMGISRREVGQYFQALTWPDGTTRVTIESPRAKYLGQFDLTAEEGQRLREFLTARDAEERRGTPPPPPPMKVGDRGDTIGTDGVRRTRVGQVVTGHNKIISGLWYWVVFLAGVTAGAILK